MYEPLEIAEEKMEKTLSSLAEDYSTIRAGRANPNVLNKITVDYYGSPTPLQQVANISVPEARMLVIQPWDRSLIKAIEKAIQASDVGINPNNDGTVGSHGAKRCCQPVLCIPGRRRQGGSLAWVFCC